MTGMKQVETKPMTSREFVEILEEFIELKVNFMTHQGECFTSEERQEKLELLRRQLSDKIKDLDHQGGIAVFGENDT